MKIKKSIFSLLAILLLALSCLSQQSMSGKVVEILDGKTIIVETPDKAKFALKLQHVETPGDEYPISKTVKDHLQKLAFGKTVDFQVKAVDQGKNISKVMVGDVDLSQQLLRDGAAWYTLENVDQDVYERDEYLKIENAAKTENRGVWSDPKIKPSWQIKAEKEAEAKRLAKIAEDEKADADFEKRRIAREKANARVQIWADIPVAAEQNNSSSSKNIFDPNNEITFEYDEFKDEGYAFTPGMILRAEGHSSRLFVFKYHYFGNKVKKGGADYEFVVTTSNYDDEVIFLTAKGERFNLGSGNKPGKSVASIYSISRSALSKISAGDFCYVKIGVSKYALDKPMLNAIKRLLAAT